MVFLYLFLLAYATLIYEEEMEIQRIKGLAFLPKVIKLPRKNQYFNYGLSEPERSSLPTAAPASVATFVQLRPQIPSPSCSLGKEVARGLWPEQAGQLQAGREVLENTFRAEFFVQNGSEFPASCQGWEVTSAQPIWQAHAHLGCHDVREWRRGCLG